MTSFEFMLIPTFSLYKNSYTDHESHASLVVPSILMDVPLAASFSSQCAVLYTAVEYVDESHLRRKYSIPHGNIQVSINISYGSYNFLAKMLTCSKTRLFWLIALSNSVTDIFCNVAIYVIKLEAKTIYSRKQVHDIKILTFIECSLQV